MKKIIAISILIIATVAVLYLIPHKSQAPSNRSSADVVDFESCADAGYPITETEPATCRTPDGQVFTASTDENPDVVIDEPQFGALVTSPMAIKGKVRGNWFFEANLPMVLKDDKGNIIAQQGYKTSENWMTNDYINIDTTMTFTSPASDNGVLVIQKDNPSGLPQNDLEFAVPVRFR